MKRDDVHVEDKSQGREGSGCPRAGSPTLKRGDGEAAAGREEGR